MNELDDPAWDDFEAPQAPISVVNRSQRYVRRRGWKVPPPIDARLWHQFWIQTLAALASKPPHVRDQVIAAMMAGDSAVAIDGEKLVAVADGQEFFRLPLEEGGGSSAK